MSSSVAKKFRFPKRAGRFLTENPSPPEIHDHGMGEGNFRNDPAKIDETPRFVLDLGCIDALIVGFEKQEEIDDYKQRLVAALERKAARS